MPTFRFLAGLSLAFATAAAFAVDNPSFEFPETPPGTFIFQPGGNPWTMSATAGIAFGSTPYGVSAHTGNQYGFFSVPAGGSATMTQTLTGLTPGQLYRVQFWLARPDFTYSSNASSVAVSIDGNEIGGGSLSTNDVWSLQESPAFRATAASHVLQFRAFYWDNTQASAASIDDVSVVATTDTLLSLNGSFEAPVLPAGQWRYGCSGAGAEWYFEGQASSSVGSGISRVPGAFGQTAASGSQVAFVQKNGFMQRLLHELRVGQPYTIRFQASKRNDQTPGPQANLLLDGNPLISGITASAAGTWDSYETAVFVPTSSPGFLRFQGIDVGADRTILFDDIQVLPIDFTDFTITPSGIVCGNVATGQLTISRPAPAGGATIQLLPSSAFIKTPASVTIPEGGTTANFQITTGVNTVTTMKQVRARFGLLQKTRNIVVYPADLASVAVSPSSIVGGSNGTGTVMANGTAAANFVVNLASSGPEVVVPASVTIPITKNKVTFVASTLPVSGTKTRYVTATRASRTRTATVLVTP